MRSASLSTAAVALLVLTLLMGGCPQPCPDVALSRDELVAACNANAAAVPRLRARAAIDASFPDENGIIMHVGSALLAPESLLAVRQADRPLGPHDFCLQIRYSSQEVGRIGISTADDTYYFWTKFGEHRSGIFGRNALAGAPGARELPIDPQQLLAVLNVTPLPDDFTQPPVVVMTMDTTPGSCAYVLTYISRQPVTNKLFARREAYFRWQKDEANRPVVPPGPYMVKFFDEQGRRVMTASLKDYQPIKVVDVDDPPAKAPVMPTDIEIDWPQRRSRIHLVLSEMTTADVVSPKFFLFWERLAASGMTDAVRSVDPAPAAGGAAQ